jgi:hypothetical protein
MTAIAIWAIVDGLACHTTLCNLIALALNHEPLWRPRESWWSMTNPG